MSDAESRERVEDKDYGETFGELIDSHYTAEDFSGHLGELLADDYSTQIPLHIKRFLQGVYELACSVID